MASNEGDCAGCVYELGWSCALVVASLTRPPLWVRIAHYRSDRQGECPGRDVLGTDPRYNWPGLPAHGNLLDRVMSRAFAAQGYGRS